MLLIESTPQPNESAQANNILLHSLKIKNFLNFEQLKIKAFAQINLITGDNDSGKTHLLKLLYTLVK
ncbi:MAG: AAA family ATPase, partial [Pseudomonadota bacterium]|nr:AAA family ATPase [Pseudomonadota bacterium]